MFLTTSMLRFLTSCNALQSRVPNHACPSALPQVSCLGPLSAASESLWESVGQRERESQGLRSLGTPDRLAPRAPQAQFPCTFIWHRLADGYAGQSRQLASWPGAPSGWHLGHLDGLPARLPQACSWQQGADGPAGRAVSSPVSCQLALLRLVPWHLWTGISGQEG